MADLEAVDFVQSCWHESGHAAIAAALGLPVRAVAAGPGYGGQVEIDAPPGTRAARALAVAALAGVIAERRVVENGRRFNRQSWLNGQRLTPYEGFKMPALADADARAVDRYLANNYFTGDGGAERRRLEAEAGELVKEHWPAIRGLVDALTADFNTADFSARLAGAQLAAALEGVKV